MRMKMRSWGFLPHYQIHPRLSSSNGSTFLRRRMKSHGGIWRPLWSPIGTQKESHEHQQRRRVAEEWSEIWQRGWIIMLICDGWASVFCVFILGVVLWVVCYMGGFILRLCQGLWYQRTGRESDKRKVSSPNLPVGNKELEILREISELKSAAN